MSKQRMSKKTYLTLWTVIFVFILGAVGFGNYEALKWDSALTLFFGEVGAQQTAEGQEGDSIYFPSDFKSAQERLAHSEDIAARITSEGAVLLKNNGALPLASGKVSLLGIDNKTNTLKSALEAEGFTVNPVLADFYAQSQHESGVRGLSAGNGSETGSWIIDEVPQSEYTDAVKASYKDYNDAAIVVLKRTGAEGNDLPYDMSRYGGSADENYLELNQAEKDLFLSAAENFESIIVLIDSANPMQMDFVDQEAYGIDAVLWYARVPYGPIAELITGKQNPSGRTVDTYVYDNLSSAAMQNFGDFRYVNSDGTLTGYSYVNYAEGIYVGYKYYETRYEDAVMGTGHAGDYDYASTVVYPFGYGLSYTTFEWSDFKVSEKDGVYTASVTVKNTGSTAGKDVVEFYVQSPYLPGGTEKAAVSLIQYGKTSLLESGKSETVTVSFTEQDLASYDDVNARTYVLDAGDWYFTAARNAHDAVNQVLSAKGYSVSDGMTADGNTALTYKETRSEQKLLSVSAATGNEITNKLDGIIRAEEAVYLSRSDWSVLDNLGLRYANTTAPGASRVGNASGDTPAWVASEDILRKLALTGVEAALNPNDFSDEAKYPGKDAYTYGAENGIALVQMMGLDYDDPKWDDLLDELKLSEMHALFNKSGWGSTAVEAIGKPKTLEFDAPHGIANFLTDEVIYGYPSATQLAATWNQELQHEYGITIGNDAVASGTSGWYAPGINIHRTPFGARNYEYYSEDAVLTGLCAANVCEGTESKGMHAYIKHFVMNDADTNRAANGCVAVYGTEQAAREIYLKPFQYSIEKGNAQGIMLTMCRVGWQYTYGSYPLMTDICRNEFGFNGCYITDYTTTMKGAGSDMYLAAGGNLVHATAEQTLSDVKSGWCRALIRDAVHSILYNTANSLAMNGIEGGEKAKTGAVSGGFPIYKIALYAFDAIVLLLLLIGMIRVYSKCRMTESQFQSRKRMSKKGKRILYIVLAMIVIAIALIFYLWAWPLLVKAFKI
ncbi:MAG: glycoside hydrolase family 3 C-terminal domain-containing protein [Clostridia bacterium]|nr:glycoside hydrolase family 3 C-terminal domain-containing protein [Clostridia bacterium]